VGVVPAGSDLLSAAKVVAGHVTGFLQLACQVLPEIAGPTFALDRQRHQYNAGRIIDFYDQCGCSGPAKVIYLVNLDLFEPVFTHVFGESRMGGRVALVSVHRLMPTEPAQPPHWGLERVAKVALHELGHLFALTHCDDTGCLMHFAGDSGVLDTIPLLFCRYCRQSLEEALIRYCRLPRSRV
jgi:archaemetzincin